MTDAMGIATIFTLYQAGNGIYDLFDKVLVLDEGKQVYYGPMEQARPFMESQGFVCLEGANVADYLPVSLFLASDRSTRTSRIASLATISNWRRPTANHP